MDTYFLGNPLLAGSSSDSSTDSTEMISLPTFEDSILSSPHGMTKGLSNHTYLTTRTTHEQASPSSRFNGMRKQNKANHTSVKNLQYEFCVWISCSFTPPPQPVVVNTVPELDVVEVGLQAFTYF